VCHLRNFFFCCKDKGKLLGFIIVKEGKLMLIAVDKGFRKQGIGEALVELALKEFGELNLKVREGNKEAIQFYKRTRWTQKSRIEGAYRNGEAGIIYEKRKR
jgi:ribosomal protein S18 acetylase RimI-like enzyme